MAAFSNDFTLLLLLVDGIPIDQGILPNLNDNVMPVIVGIGNDTFTEMNVVIEREWREGTVREVLRRVRKQVEEWYTHDKAK
jgi:hypothetical protein